MNTNEIDISTKLKVSYYSSYKNFKTQGLLPYWPFFLTLLFFFISAVFTKGSNLTIFLLFFSVIVLLICALVTRFYANSYLTLTDKKIKIESRGFKKELLWKEVSNFRILIPKHGLSYLELIIYITVDGETEFIFVNSLYFEKAKSRIQILKPILESKLKNFKFGIDKSQFEPYFLNKRVEL